MNNKDFVAETTIILFLLPDGRQDSLQLCGNIPQPVPVTTETDRIILKFTSDNYVVGRGFKIEFYGLGNEGANIWQHVS